MTERIPFVDLGAQYAEIEDELREALAKVLSQSSYILGPPVAEFEGAFAEFLGVEHVIGVGSGLDALRLALDAAGVGPGDEVIVPANTFVATALAVTALGAIPVLVDCQRETFQIDPDHVAGAISPRTRAIVPVHLTGAPADMHRILPIAEAYGVAVVEDAAQAHGASLAGRACGSFGLAGCFSFYPAKNLGALGDAGAVSTNDAVVAARIRSVRDYGRTSKYEHVEYGLNTRLDSIHAAALSVKLRRLEGWNQQRRERASVYRELLRGVGDLQLQEVVAGAKHAYHLFVVRTERRDELQAALAADGIDTIIHYPIPVHLQPVYRDLGYRTGQFPVAEELAATSLSLPMYAELPLRWVERVARNVSRFFARVPA